MADTWESTISSHIGDTHGGEQTGVKAHAASVQQRQPAAAGGSSGGSGAGNAMPTRKREDAPIAKLSTGLLNTYLGINERYYASLKKKKAAAAAAATTTTAALAPAAASASSQAHKTRQESIAAASLADASSSSSSSSAAQPVQAYDDENSDYIIRIGEVWDGRYKVLKVLGRGSFGQVVEAYDSHTKENQAIKIIKNKRAFYHQALLEIRILQFLNASDKKDQHHVVKMKRHFEWRNHLCISYELLSMNLYELLRNQNFAGVSLNLVKKFAVQILTALKFLARSDIGVIHCDLKPENILLKNPKRSALKVVDFGSSCFHNQKTYTYIQSRFYRSPEVLLGLPYHMSIDMWSLGCLLVEMHTGSPLFDGLTEHEQVCKITDTLGMPPPEFISAGSPQKIGAMFRKGYSGAFSVVHSKNFKPQGKTLEDVVKAKMYSIAAASGNGGGVSRETVADYDSFVDLIARMLTYVPQQRISPDDALAHPWLSNIASMSSSSAATAPTTAGGSSSAIHAGAPAQQSSIAASLYSSSSSSATVAETLKKKASDKFSYTMPWSRKK